MLMIDLLARLKGVHRCGRDRWTACCPAHDDYDPSLSVAHRSGRWLLKCFAGCSVEAITAVLGLRVGDLFDDTHTHPPIIKDFPVRSIAADAAEIAHRLEKARQIWRDRGDRSWGGSMPISRAVD
jgi:hypothetical protein